MKFSYSKLGLIFSLSYLTIFLFSGVYAIFMLVFRAVNSEFSGLWAILLTVPWSMFIPYIGSINSVPWYEKFVGNPAVYGLFAMLTLLPAALLNAVILYFVGRAFDGAVKITTKDNKIGGILNSKWFKKERVVQLRFSFKRLFYCSFSLVLMIIASITFFYWRGKDVVINIDKSFEYVPEGWPLGLYAGETNAVIFTHKPYEFVREPYYFSQQVLYGYLELGNFEDNRVFFVVDGLDSGGWFVYFDQNNNRDLTDDGPPYTNEGTGKFAATFSFNVKIPANDGVFLRPYKFWLWINEEDNVKQVKFYATCHYRGKVYFGKKEYTAIAFEQSRYDALYKDSGLWIDLNADGKLDEKTEHFLDGALIKIEGKRYRLHLDYF